MPKLRPIDYSGHVPAPPVPDRPERRYAGWSNVPGWLRWFMFLNLTAALGLLVIMVLQAR